jgi:hypothetical protein
LVSTALITTKKSSSNNINIRSSRKEPPGIPALFSGLDRDELAGVPAAVSVRFRILLKMMPQLTHSSEAFCSKPHLGHELIFFINFKASKYHGLHKGLSEQLSQNLNYFIPKQT